MAPAVDRISNLPKNVTEGILMLLPIRDAVRTSILSRNWRDEWTTLPQLVFEEDCVKHYIRLFPKYMSSGVYDVQRREIVDRVLLLHVGPIRKFKLSFNLERCGVIDSWIRFISRNGIKELTLDKWKGVFYDVPSCLYLCEEITHLELYRCTIVLPASFKGFSRLTTLSLRCVNFANSQLKILISACPLLKKLALVQINGRDRLNICALKLVDLKVDIAFQDIFFENTPLLDTLSMNLSLGEDLDVSVATVCKIDQLLRSLPGIERLTLCGYTFKILSKGVTSLNLPIACRLKFLSINVNFGDFLETRNALYIFKISPALQKLHIKCQSQAFHSIDNAEIYWEVWSRTFKLLRIAQGALDYWLSRLKTVEVTDFRGTTSELEFVEFVLAKAPILEKVEIELKEDADGALDILTKMIRFPRISSKAEIIFRAQAPLAVRLK